MVLADDDLLFTSGRGIADEESGRLRAAIAGASDELTALMERVDDAEANAILAFQVAMLADPVVTEPALAGIAAGDSAEQAWRAGLAPVKSVPSICSAPSPWIQVRARDGS